MHVARNVHDYTLLKYSEADHGYDNGRAQTSMTHIDLMLSANNHHAVAM